MRSALGRAVLACTLVACAHDQPSSSAAGGQAGAQQAVPPGKYGLHLVLRPGEVRRYGVNVDVRSKVTANDAVVADFPLKMSYQQVLEVQSGEGGTPELRERLEKIQLLTEGAGEMMRPMIDAIGKVVVISRLRPDGELISRKMEGAGDELKALVDQFFQGARFAFLPRQPVGPGDTWTTEERRPMILAQGQHVDLLSVSKLKFTAVEACGAKQCAHIESDTTMSVPENPTASGSGESHSVMLVELDDGRPFRSTGTQKSSLQSSQGGSTYDITSSVSFTSELQ
jgi:hypothetical protein